MQREFIVELTFEDQASTTAPIVIPHLVHASSADEAVETLAARAREAHLAAAMTRYRITASHADKVQLI